MSPTYDRAPMVPDIKKRPMDFLSTHMSVPIVARKSGSSRCIHSSPLNRRYRCHAEGALYRVGDDRCLCAVVG